MPFIGIGLGIGKQSVGGIEPFTFTVDTTKSGVSSSTQFQLPLVNDGNTLNAEVDWGDGTSDTITAYNQAETLHTYSSSGTYTISITGNISGWQFNNIGDRLKILNVVSWGSLNISVDKGFYGCTNLNSSAIDAPTITSASLERYFTNCFNFNGQIGVWNTSNVTSMVNIFRNATAFNQYIGSWNMSSTTNLQDMFRGASSFDQDISDWDINQVSTFTNFMLAATLSTSNYDLLLVDWEANLQNAYPGGVGYPYTIGISFGGSQYTIESAAETARTSLINNFGWTITDGGGV